MQIPVFAEEVRFGILEVCKEVILMFEVPPPPITSSAISEKRILTIGSFTVFQIKHWNEIGIVAGYIKTSFFGDDCLCNLEIVKSITTANIILEVQVSGIHAYLFW